jgi:hypothetical protein
MGGSAPKTMTQTNTTKLSPEQQQIFDLALPHIQNYASSTPSIYSGTGIAGFDPREIAAQGMFTNVADTTGTSLAGAAANAQGQLMDPDFMLNPNQYVEAAATGTTNQVTKNLLENIIPNIRSGASAAGGQYSGGSTREGVATGKAIGDTNQGLSNSLANMYLANYQGGLKEMGNAIGRNQDVMTQQLFPGQVYSAVGAQARGLEQAKLDEEIRKFYAAQDLDLTQAQQTMGLMAGMPGGTGVSTVTGVAPQSNPLMQVLGLGATGLGYGLGGPLGGAAAGAGTSAITAGK